MRIALGQILATKDIERNLWTVGKFACRAARLGADAVVFPEAAMLSFGGRLYNDVVAGHHLWERNLAQIAEQAGITVVAGSFAPAPSADPASPRVLNQIRVVSAEGTAQVYSKIHLYDAFGFRESDGVVAGSSPVVVEIAGARVGLAICYDVRFPKLFAELSRAGAEVVVVVASWAGGEGKLAQWQLLTSARALDSNTFVVAVDQADPRFADVAVDVTKPLGVGFSRVVSPFGVTLAELGEKPELAVVDVDLAQVQRARSAIPVLENARLGY